MNYLYIINRILFIFLSISFLNSQSAEDFKRFKDNYDKVKAEKEFNDVVKKGIESEDDLSTGPVKLLVDPGDITKYYREKMVFIQNDLNKLNKLLLSSDSIPPITHFGYNYFSLRDSIQFIDNANVSADYVLGYGDEVIISIWGQAEQHDRKTLDRDGTVFFENVGLLYLGGKTQAQAKSYLIDRFSKVYSTLKTRPQLTFLEFSIGKIKNINVSVSGHVQFPGNYVVNPSISIPNILILAGGVNSNGTLRNIFVQRSGEVVDTLDLYPLITGVGIIQHIPVFEGDIIVVPSRGETVSVTGNVLNAAYYELKSQENISTILKYSGAGLIDSEQELIIARPQSSSIYIKYSDFNKTLLIDRDSLIVPLEFPQIKSISVSVSNRELIEIPWYDRLTFDQILNITAINKKNIKFVELIRRDFIKNKQEILPFDSKNSLSFKFLPSDHLSIHLFDIFSPTKTVVVKGEVNSPGTYPIINNQESLSSIIERAGGLQGSISMDNVLVKRDTLIFGSKTGNLIITPGDTIIAKPLLGTVKVLGSVHNPGNFEWEMNLTAKNYLSFAGGLTAYGDKKHIVYITPFGQATRITQSSGKQILPGSTIRVSEKPISEQNIRPDRFQQISSIVTSLVSIAILANTSRSN